MRAKLILTAVLVMIVGGSLVARVLLSQRERPATAENAVPQRIVSISPSITEILFALGLGDGVVGVTRFCQYPPEAQTRTIVGGYLDPNYEAIVALKPDLIVLRGENRDSVAAFERLGLPTLVVRHDNIEGLLDSIEAIGRRCGAEDRGREMVAELRAKMAEIERQNQGRPRPRVMIVAERTLGTGKIENVYVAGGDGFMNHMIRLAGGENACPSRTIGFPVVSAEGILQMNPEVILDLVAKHRQGDLSREAILGDWQQLSGVEAVRQGRVYLVDDDYAFIPGPRFIRLVETLSRLVHGPGEPPR